MNTAYYTFTTWNDGGIDGSLAEDRQGTMVRRARPQGGDNVIDLNAWKAANPELLQAAEDEAEWGAEELDQSQLTLPAPRFRKSRRARFLAELASTMSVAAAALAIIVRVLVF